MFPEFKILMISCLFFLLLNFRRDKTYESMDNGIDFLFDISTFGTCPTPKYPEIWCHPDGKTLNTKAIQAAIDRVAADGGGRVVIPAGRFLSGSIVLKSGVELHLEKNAVLLGSTRAEDYTQLHNNTCVGYKALVLAYEAENIAITGAGEIDGQGARLARNIDSLFYIGQIDTVAYELQERRPKWFLRPKSSNS